MNSLIGDNVVNEDYILPCNFHDIEESPGEVNPLSAQIDLNLDDQVSRNDGFDFDSRFPQDETQIRGLADNDKNFFLMKSSILPNTYQQFDTQNGLCYIAHTSDNITCLSNSAENKCNISNSEVTCHLEVSTGNMHINNSDLDGTCCIIEDANNVDGTTDKCYIANSAESRCYVSDDTGVNSEGALGLSKTENDLSYFNNSNYFTQNVPCSANATQNSITKTLRNIKRIPPPQQAIVSLQPADMSYVSDSSYKPCFDVLSCTILIDTKSKNEKDLNVPVDEKGLDTTESISKGKDGFPSSNARMYECPECGKQFREKSHLVTHSRAHTVVRKFKCSKCDLSFKTEVNLRFHLNAHNEEPLKCPHCSKQFAVRRVLSRHIRLVHSMENFECEQCGKRFKTRKNLIHHYGIHSGVRPYSCNICSKSFLHSSSLNTHMREHSLQQDCLECSGAIQTTTIDVTHNSNTTDLEINSEIVIDNLTDDQHINVVNRHCHNTVPALCSCVSLCTGNCKDGKNSSSQFSCQHVCKPFVCSTCGKPFKLKSSLITHMKTHTPSVEYKCEECGKSFVKKISYDIHMKQHRGERPEFMCDQCSQSYHSQFSLKRHYLKHTTHKNFHCQICDKKFWMKDALQVHLRSHTKERNFKCSLCEKCFSHKSSLVTHVRSFHPQSLQNQELVYCSSETVQIA